MKENRKGLSSLSRIVKNVFVDTSLNHKQPKLGVQRSLLGIQHCGSVPLTPPSKTQNKWSGSLYRALPTHPDSVPTQFQFLLLQTTSCLMSTVRVLQKQKLKSPQLGTQSGHLSLPKAWSRSEYSYACFALCQGFFPVFLFFFLFCLFLFFNLPNPFIVTFFQIYFLLFDCIDFGPCWPVE